MENYRRTLLMIAICFVLSSCATSLVVNSDGDGVDKNVGDGKCETVQGDCTLRAAIMEGNHVADVSKITFENVSLIKPDTHLPDLTAGNTHIDGNGKVTLNGENIEGSATGLRIYNSSYNIIQGMRIINFGRGISIYSSFNELARYNKIGLLQGNLGDSTKVNVINNNTTGIQIHGEGASDNVISGNKIGTTANNANAASAIQISNGAHDNLIGSLSDISVNQGGNLLGANNGHGIYISSAANNQISGNFIGTFWNDNGTLGNDKGISISQSNNNIIGIGPDGSGFRNVISGNDSDGIHLFDSDGNIIAGNHIGTNYTGNTSIPNTTGIKIYYGSSQNIIGTNGDGINDTNEGNLISGNSNFGIRITSTNSSDNVISGNYIGTTASGSASLGNDLQGIFNEGDQNRIGTNGDGVSDADEANLISGNGVDGIYINSASNIVAGNYIGIDSSGMTAIPNYDRGINIGPISHHNIIGTDGDGMADSAERNIISGNGTIDKHGAGIAISGNENVVAGNFIGVDATGNTGIGNISEGIMILQGGAGNRIGTDGDGTADLAESNLISGNGRTGIWISDGSDNTVAGNLIGTDLNGTAAIPNGHGANFEAVGGVHISNGSTGNIIGTNSDGNGDSIEGNLISGNTERGVVIKDDYSQNNIVAGNLIGTDISGTAALGNNSGGVEIQWNAEFNRIGTNGDGNADTLERNIISGNATVGVLIGGSNNEIAGNYIGTDISGSTGLGNSSYGIKTDHKADDNTIGGSLQKSNIIAFNGADGIFVFSQQHDKTLITHNSIHSNDGIGINLATSLSDWYTLNDFGDGDVGPNDLLNFPDLDSASTNNSSTLVTGGINIGLLNTQFEIHFYASDVCDPSGYGEGKTFLGEVTIGTNNQGNASLLVNLTPGAAAGQFITATATSNGQTSEFSNCVEVTETTNFSQELDDPICDELDPELTKLVTFQVKPEDRIFDLYLKNLAGPFPGGEGEASNENDDYYAELGDLKSLNCNHQEFPDRLYCRFHVGEEDVNSTKELKIFFGPCGEPIYFNPGVSIFPYVPPEQPVCKRDLGRAECNEAEGTYIQDETGAYYCSCP